MTRHDPRAFGVRTLASVLILIAALLSAMAARAQDTPADWSGTWDSRWRDGGARLILEQDGASVTGTYPLYGGRIEAEATGRELRGRWIEAGRSGDFVFVQSPDGRSFAGRFESGEWWTGARTAAGAAGEAAVDQSTPMAVMRSFLVAANAAADGDLDAFGAAAAVVLPADPQDESVDRFDHARALFEVIDQTTFRLWDLPQGPPADGATETVTLRQAGTGEEIALAFRAVDGAWFIIAPPLADLAETRARLAAARAPGDATDTAPGSRSPRAAMRAFLTGFGYAADGSDPGTQGALDLRGRPEVTRAHDGQVLAGYLKRVIDRTGYVIWQEIPDDPASAVPYVHFEHPDGNVVIAPVPTEAGPVWQFTPDTLRTIRAVYAAIEDMPVAEGLDDLADTDLHFAIRGTLRAAVPGALAPLGPLERWQWAGLAGTLLAVVAAALLAGAVLRRSEAGAGVVGWSARGIAAGLVLFAASRLLDLPDRFTVVLVALSVVAIVLGAFLLGWKGIGVFSDSHRRAARISGHNLILLSLATGLMRAALVVAAVFVLAEALSLPVTGVLAGLGIGGIAVALAAQPTLQNLISGFTLYADRPISVGDFCRFGDRSGTVESIGLRSTRLRTLDRTVISVPNSQFLDLQLENFGLRDRFLFSTVLQLRYETTPDQLRYLLATLRNLLIAHPSVLPDPLRVRFAAFGAHSLDVEVFSYVRAADMAEFAGIREDLLLRIMAIVAEAGTQFAFPSVVHYAATDQAPDPDAIRRAEEEVDRWRTEGTLPFPDDTWQNKAERSGTLDFPPRGSVLSGGPGPG